MPRDPIVAIIDDDAAALASVNALLCMLGFELHSFESAEAFLDFDDGSYHGCILSDVRLPGLNGLDLLHRLAKQSNQWAVILITGYADPEMAAEATESGAFAVLEKPIDPQTLIQQVRAAMNREPKP